MSVWAENLAEAFADLGAVIVTPTHGSNYVMVPLNETESLEVSRLPGRGAYELHYRREGIDDILIATGHELLGIRMALRAELVRASLT